MARRLTAGRAAHLRTVARIERRLRPLLRTALRALGDLLPAAEWTAAAAIRIPPASLSQRLQARLQALHDDLVRRLVTEAVTESLFTPGPLEHVLFALARTPATGLLARGVRAIASSFSAITIYEQTSPDDLARLRIGALIRELEDEGLGAVRLQLSLIADAGITPEAVSAIGQATGLTRRQVAQVERARRNALLQGASEATAARAAVGVRTRLLDVRARLIARTETVRYVGDLVQARGEAAQAAGADVVRQWVSARDEHVDAGDPFGPCRINDDGKRYGMTEPFPSGDDRPPAHPACRCLLELWVEAA